MPKVGMEPIRRRQVIDATMACILEEGMSRASMQRIARRAGITSGLILHYFDDKNGLFEAVYRDLYRRLGEETLQRLKQAATPTERLYAVMEAQVSDEMLQPQTVATWFAICAKIPEIPELARLERANARRLTSNLVYTLKQIGLSRSDSADIAEEFMALIYGLWLSLANRTPITPQKARDILLRQIRARLPQLRH